MYRYLRYARVRPPSRFSERWRALSVEIERQVDFKAPGGGAQMIEGAAAGFFGVAAHDGIEQGAVFALRLLRMRECATGAAPRQLA